MRASVADGVQPGPANWRQRARLSYSAAQRFQVSPGSALTSFEGHDDSGEKALKTGKKKGKPAQAVAAAMSLLQNAEKVDIITCGAETDLGPKSSQLVNYLRYWGVKAESIRTGGDDDARAIIKAHNEARSDLLVMGAYSRSRLSQRIFGGVTQFMLYKANIPVLMLHS